MAAPMKFWRSFACSPVFRWKILERKHVAHAKKNSLFISSLKKSRLCNLKYLFAVPAAFSPKLFASSDLSEPADVRNFEPNDSRLRSSECLKNAAGLAVDSTSAVLSQTVYTIIKIEQQYIELIDVLIQLMEYQVQVLGHKTEVQRIEDIILETRHEINKVLKRKQDLALLFGSVEKLADATAEVAFASGADYASTSAGERLVSAQREVQRVHVLSEEAQKRLVEVEAGVITQVSKHEEKLKRMQEKAQENMNDNNNAESDVSTEENNNETERQDNKREE